MPTHFPLDLPQPRLINIAGHIYFRPGAFLNMSLARTIKQLSEAYSRAYHPAYIYVVMRNSPVLNYLVPTTLLAEST